MREPSTTRHGAEKLGFPLSADKRKLLEDNLQKQKKETGVRK